MYLGMVVVLTKALVHGWDNKWMKELQMRSLLDIALIEAVKIQTIEHHLYLARGGQFFQMK